MDMKSDYIFTQYIQLRHSRGHKPGTPNADP